MTAIPAAARARRVCRAALALPELEPLGDQARSVFQLKLHEIVRLEMWRHKDSTLRRYKRRLAAGRERHPE